MIQGCNFQVRKVGPFALGSEQPPCPNLRLNGARDTLNTHETWNEISPACSFHPSSLTIPFHHLPARPSPTHQLSYTSQGSVVSLPFPRLRPRLLLHVALFSEDSEPQLRISAGRFHRAAKAEGGVLLLFSHIASCTCSSV